MTKPNPIYKIAGDLEVNRFGYGAMQLTGWGFWGETTRRDLAKKVLLEVVESGVNFIDTADSYGPETNEILIAETLSDFYDKITIATKGGYERTGPYRWVVNGHPDHIRDAIEGSLKRLKTNRIDLWQLHRVDSRYPLEDTLAPVADAVNAGKIRFVGLSEVSVKDIERALKVLPIVSVQNRFNLGDRRWEDVLDYTIEKQMAFIPWYPLASDPESLKNKTWKIAANHNATTAQIALAWLYHRAENILLIPGTHSVEHLKENLEAAQIRLSEEEFLTLSE
jgi:pyridoxine 4-dehydrogenase